MKLQRVYLQFIFCMLCLLPGTKSFTQDNLPQILNQAPTQKFEVLGPVSATEPKVEEARTELARQAHKLGAQAVVLKHCEAPSIRREGLTWISVHASCEGTAIKFTK
ncbi:MAG: hypothetical protein HQM15_05085 [Deltaproteobacteria bacterium]|nr:hypothetical protein [Deltaproteobacteria bacterium]